MRTFLNLITIIFFSSPVWAQRCESLFSLEKSSSVHEEVYSTLSQLFNPENLIFTMAQNTGLREQIMRSEAQGGFEFKNMYQTKTSNALAPTEVRFENEAIRLGMTPQEMSEKLQPESLPKYGYLQFKQNPLTGATNTKLFLKSYGEDFYTFKYQSVYESSTMTVGDSFMVTRSKTTLRKALEMGTLKSENSMNNRFISFQHEKFFSWLADVLFAREAKQIAKKYAFRQQPVPDEAMSLKMAMVNWLKSSSIAQPFFGDGLLQLENTGLGFRRKYAYNYFEVQYQKRPLSLNDVETFTFSKTPPSPEFIQLLRSHGIKIYDATNPGAEPVLLE